MIIGLDKRQGLIYSFELLLNVKSKIAQMQILALQTPRLQSLLFLHWMQRLA